MIPSTGSLGLRRRFRGTRNSAFLGTGKTPVLDRLNGTRNPLFRGTRDAYFAARKFAKISAREIRVCGPLGTVARAHATVPRGPHENGPGKREGASPARSIPPGPRCSGARCAAAVLLPCDRVERAARIPFQPFGEQAGVWHHTYPAFAVVAPCGSCSTGPRWGATTGAQELTASAQKARRLLCAYIPGTASRLRKIVKHGSEGPAITTSAPAKEAGPASSGVSALTGLASR